MLLWFFFFFKQAKVLWYFLSSFNLKFFCSVILAWFVWIISIFPAIPLIVCLLLLISLHYLQFLTFVFSSLKYCFCLNLLPVFDLFPHKFEILQNASPVLYLYSYFNLNECSSEFHSNCWITGIGNLLKAWYCHHYLNWGYSPYMK